MWNISPREVLPTSLYCSSSTSQISDSAAKQKRLKIVAAIATPPCAVNISHGLKNELFVSNDGDSEAHSLCTTPTRNADNTARRVTSTSASLTPDTAGSCELAGNPLQISRSETNERPFFFTCMEKKSWAGGERCTLPSVPLSDCPPPHLSDRQPMDSPRPTYVADSSPSDDDDHDEDKDGMPTRWEESEDVEQKEGLKRRERQSSVDEEDFCSIAESDSTGGRNRDMYYVTSSSSFSFPSSRHSSGIASFNHPLKHPSSPSACILPSPSISSPFSPSVSVELVDDPGSQKDHCRPSSAPCSLPKSVRCVVPSSPSPSPSLSPAAVIPPEDTRIRSNRISFPLPLPLSSNDDHTPIGKHHCWMSSRAFSRAAWRHIEEREGMKKWKHRGEETKQQEGHHARTSPFYRLSPHTEKSSPDVQDALHALVSGVWCRLGLFQAFPTDEAIPTQHSSGRHAAPRSLSKDEKWDGRERDAKEGEVGVGRGSRLFPNTHPCHNPLSEEEDEAEKEREVCRADMMCRWLTEYLRPATAMRDQDTVRCDRRTGLPQKSKAEAPPPQRDRAASLSLLHVQYPSFTRALWHLLWNTVQYSVGLHAWAEPRDATPSPLPLGGTGDDASLPSSMAAEWTPSRLRYDRVGNALLPTEVRHHHPQEGSMTCDTSISDAMSSATAATLADSPVPTERRASESTRTSQWTRRPSALENGGSVLQREKWRKKNEMESASQKKSSESGERNRSAHVFYHLEDLCEQSYGKSGGIRGVKTEEVHAKREWSRAGERCMAQANSEREKEEVNRHLPTSLSHPTVSFMPPIGLSRSALRSHGRAGSGAAVERLPKASHPACASPPCRTTCVLTTSQWSHLLRCLSLLGYPRAVFYTQTLHHCSPSELLLALLWCTREYHFIELVEQVVLHEQFPFMLSKDLLKKDSQPHVSPFPSGASYVFQRNANVHEKKKLLAALLPSTMNWPPLHLDFAAMWRYRKKQLPSWNTIHRTSPNPTHVWEKIVGPPREDEKSSSRSRSRRSDSGTSRRSGTVPVAPPIAEGCTPHEGDEKGVVEPPLPTPVTVCMPVLTRGILGLQKLFFSSLHRLEHALFERAQMLHVLGQEITHMVPVPAVADRFIATPQGASTETLSLPASPLDLLLCSLARSDEDSEAEGEDMTHEEEGENQRHPAMVSTGGGARREGRREGSGDVCATMTPSLYALYMAGLYYMATLPARVERRRMHLRLLGSAVRASLVAGRIEDEVEAHYIQAYASGLENNGGARSCRHHAGTSISHPHFPASLSSSRFQHSHEGRVDSKTAFPLLFFLHHSPYTFSAMKPLYVPQVAAPHSGGTLSVWSRPNVSIPTTTPTFGRTTSSVRHLTKGKEETMCHRDQPSNLKDCGIHRADTVHSLYGNGTEKAKEVKENEKEKDALRSSVSSSSFLPLPSGGGFRSSSSSSFSSPLSSFCCWHMPSRDRIRQSVQEDRRMMEQLDEKKANKPQKAVLAEEKKECGRDEVRLTSLRHRFSATHCCDVLADEWRGALRQILLQSAQKKMSSGVCSNTATAARGESGVTFALHSSPSSFFLEHDIMVSRNMRDHYSLHSTLLAALLEQYEHATLTPTVPSLSGLSCSIVSPVRAQSECRIDGTDIAAPLTTAHTSGNRPHVGSTSSGRSRNFLLPNVSSWLSMKKKVKEGGIIKKEKKTVEVLCHPNTPTFQRHSHNENERNEGMTREKASSKDAVGGVRRLSPCLVEGSVSPWMTYQSSFGPSLKVGKENERDGKTSGIHHPCTSSALLELQRVQDLVTVIQHISSEHTKSATTLHRNEEKWNDTLLARKRSETDILWESLDMKSRAKEDRGAAAFAQLQRLYGLHPVTTCGFSPNDN